MKTNRKPVPTSAATWQQFLQKLIHEAPKKWKGLLAALLFYYIFPLAGHPSLIFTPQVAIALLACTWIYLVQPAADTNQPKSKHDKNSMLYLILATTISQATIVLEWAYFTPTHEWSYNFVTLTGLVIIVLGLWIRTVAIFELSIYFDNTIIIKEGHELIQTGTYRHIRHGSYTGAIAVGLGIGLVFESWWGFLFSLIALGLAYGYRIWYEEKALLAHFGEKYRQYQKRTFKLIPFIF